MKQLLVCCALLSIFVSALAFQVQAGNPQYRCEPDTVKNDALAIAYPNVDVGRFSDRNKGICTFAIGGASPTGPASRSRESPLKDAISRIAAGNVDAIVIRLTLARSAIDPNIKEFRESIRELLQVSAKDLEVCFSALELFSKENQPRPKQTTREQVQIYLSRKSSSFFITCSILVPGKSTTVISPSPVLHLQVRSSQGQDDSLFIPQEAAVER